MINRLSEYIAGMKLTRQLLNEAQIKHSKSWDHDAVNYLIQAFQAYISATNCVISIKDGKRPRGRK